VRHLRVGRRQNTHRDTQHIRPGAGPLGQRPEENPGVGYAGPGVDRTNIAVPYVCGGLDPDRAFSVPHTAESARQTSASTTSARERQYPQSGGEPSTVAAPARDRRSACFPGSMLPNFAGKGPPLDLLCVRVLLDEGVAPLTTVTGNPNRRRRSTNIRRRQQWDFRVPGCCLAYPVRFSKRVRNNLQ
jgi:hypothetical protein